MKISIKKLKELIKQIESEYHVDDSDKNYDFSPMNAKDGFELLMELVEKNKEI